MKIREIYEAASGGSTSAGAIASVANPIGGAGLQRRPSIFGYIDATGPVKKKKKKKRTKPIENLKKR